MPSFICTPLSTDELKNKLKLNKEAMVAGAYAGTGIPVLDSLIEDLATAAGGLAAVGMSAAVSAAQEKVKQTVGEMIGPFASSALTNIVAALNLVAELESVGQGIIADNLKQQVYLRYSMLKELQFHIQGMTNVLRRLDRRSELRQDIRLRRAYPYIKEAHSLMTKLRGMLLSSKPRFNKSLYKNGLMNIDMAISTLTTSRSTALATKFLQADRTNKLQSFGNLLAEDVLSQYIQLAEIYMWHLSNLAAISAGGYTPTGFGLTTLTKNKTIPGVASNRNDELFARQTRLNTLKNEMVANTPAVDDVMKTLTWVNANKGLILTHEAAKVSAEMLSKFPTDWAALSQSSKTLWTAITPGYGILTSVKEQVEATLARDVSKIDMVTRDIIEPVLLISWVTGGLEAAKQAFIGAEGSGVQFDAVAADKAVWDDLLEYLASKPYEDGIIAIDKVLKLLITAAAFAITGPLNKRIMKRAVVLFTEMDLLLQTGLNQDSILLQKLQNFNIMDNPGVMSAMTLLNNIAAQNPAAAGIVASMTNGGLSNVTSMVTGITASLAGGVTVLNDVYKKLFSECETTNKKTALLNSKIDEAAKVQDDRDVKDAEAREALKDAPTETWYDTIGDTTSEFLIKLTI
jgi:hypothetical protein